MSVYQIDMKDLTDYVMRNDPKKTWEFSYVIDDGSHQEVQRKEDSEEAVPSEQFEKIQSEFAEMVEQDMEQLLRDEAKDKVDTSKMNSGERIQTILSEQNHSTQTVLRPPRENREGQQNEENQQSQYTGGPQRNRNRRKTKNDYPTKNLLQNMRPIIRNYIIRHYSKALSHPIILKMKKSRASINCKDYQDLLNQPELHDILSQYFKNKQIYRDILQSGMSFESKRICHSKAGVFEKAFISGKFEKIN